MFGGVDARDASARARISTQLLMAESSLLHLAKASVALHGGRWRTRSLHARGRGAGRCRGVGGSLLSCASKRSHVVIR